MCQLHLWHFYWLLAMLCHFKTVMQHENDDQKSANLWQSNKTKIRWIGRSLAPKAFVIPVQVSTITNSCVPIWGQTTYARVHCTRSRTCLGEAKLKIGACTEINEKRSSSSAVLPVPISLCPIALVLLHLWVRFWEELIKGGEMRLSTLPANF